MKAYARTVGPDVAVITAIGSEHHRSLGTLEVTRAEKSWMLQVLPASGAAVLNGDDPVSRELGRDVAINFTNPDFVAYAESFGARGYQVRSAGDLLPMLGDALASDAVSVIACPVDYTENLRLTDALGDLSGPF